MDKPRHLHPLQMLTLTGKYLVLLILPLSRRLSLSAAGGWGDLLILPVILFCVYLTWRGSTFCCQNGCLFIKTGLFFRRESVIPLGNITALSVEAPWYLLPLNARRVWIHTAGYTRKDPSFRVLMYRRDADVFLRAHLPNIRTEHPPQYRPLWRHLLFLCFFVSNSATGAILLFTVFHRSEIAIGNTFRQQLLDELKLLTRLIPFLPQTAALIALILLIGWGLVILRHLLNHIGFIVTRYPDRLHIRAGGLVRRDILCHTKQINFLDLRESVLSRLLKLKVAFIHCAGYGRRRYDKEVLLPAVPAADIDRVTRELLWELPRLPVQLRPGPHAWFRYVRWPVITGLSIPVAVMIANRLLPTFSDLFPVLGLMVALPILWWLILSVIDRCSAGVAVSDTGYTLYYARGLVLHTAVIPKHRIRMIRIRQSVFQRWRGMCDLVVYTHHQRRGHRVRQLSKIQVYDLLQR